MMVNTQKQSIQEQNGSSLPEEISVLGTNDLTIFPGMMAPLTSDDAPTRQMMDDIVSGNRLLGLFAFERGSDGIPTETYRDIGVVATVIRMFKLPDGRISVILQGVSRARLIEVTQRDPYVKAKIEGIEEGETKSKELEALSRNLVGLFRNMVSLAPNLSDDLVTGAINMPTPGSLADFVAANLSLDLEQRQAVLEALDVEKRLETVTGHINQELEILELGNKIQSQVKDQMDQTQREYYLRQQLKAIQEELGETDERTREIEEIKEEIERTQLPPDARKEAEREMDRLAKMPPQAAEYTVSKTYLDWLTALPWAKGSEETIDIQRAAGILDEDHYDLKKVKDRVLDYLAVRKLKPAMKGPILCFVGPPGTGKTSIGQSIARALGRKFVRISLGGVRDEAEIRGHRRTYVGALPGRIIQGLRRAGSNDPVFMMDEIDKLGADFRGDPSAALLEVLDPEQNSAFVDHYLDVPFDLSRVMFIATANLVDPIPPALRDRMEILELPGYTELDKTHIAEKYLIPKQMEANGISIDNLRITKDALLAIISKYTREAGLRNLEREIGTICRKTARKIASADTEGTVINPEGLLEYLGPERFHFEVAEGDDEIGVATGLAWTQAGGDTLFVEASLVPGKGTLTLTGKLGDVMQESARAALTYCRSRFSTQDDFHDTKDIHIHVPAGAIPKDGPSAGVTMTTALASAISKRPVKKDVAMTGEITLRGKVLPVGGIKEKVMAAHRAGVKTVVLPRQNEKDLEDVPRQIKEELRFVLVEHIDEVLDEVLHSEGREASAAHH
jgi:ATP-dependent Lon protease